MKSFLMSVSVLLLVACGAEPLPDDINGHLQGKWQLKSFTNHLGEEEDVTFEQVFNFMDNDSVQTSTSTANSGHIETSPYYLEGTRLTVNELDGKILEIDAEQMKLEVEVSENNKVQYTYRRPE